MKQEDWKNKGKNEKYSEIKETNNRSYTFLH